ncbi:AmmeMemoRadiSam system protein A [Geobacter sp.]|uniref:AmmeMemoRadiSam system protein A n=1 Tax=Geobacter sp. TaxID=46610 RepID=UPI00263509D8|nr:AmmeMemoRadiSam system protein A [Geobacter sp.]
MTRELSDSDKQQLLLIAREAVVNYVANGIVSETQAPAANLNERGGCFVCIKKDGNLRGCIGNFISDKPLFQLVQEMAVSAATRDPRFYPMKTEDLADFSLEISILSPLVKINSCDEIKIGTHGIYLEKNFCRGVLLPQVATEQGWDRNTFLSQTCIKAGLRANDWEEGADIYVFSAQVFG